MSWLPLLFHSHDLIIKAVAKKLLNFVFMSPYVSNKYNNSMGDNESLTFLIVK